MNVRELRAGLSYRPCPDFADALDYQMKHRNEIGR
jgi:hypothetical protein